MCLEITSGAREVVEVMDFAPRVALGEATAHCRTVCGKVAAVALFPHHNWLWVPLAAVDAKPGR